MRILISAMLLASTAVLGAPVIAQDAPPPHHDDGGHHDGGHGGGDHHGGGGGQPQGQPQHQAARPPQGGQGGGGQPNAARPALPQSAPPQSGRGDPRFGGRPGFQGDPAQYGHPGGGYGRPGGDDGHARDRPVYQDGRPGYAGQGYAGQGFAGRPGGYDRGHGGGDNRGGGNWNRGWRDDNRYDWRGYRNEHRDIFRGGGYRAPGGYGYGYRRFGIGAALAPAFFAQDYWIADPSYYRLPPAYGPYRWVRYYNDALLIDLRSGIVVDAIPGFFF